MCAVLLSIFCSTCLGCVRPLCRSMRLLHRRHGRRPAQHEHFVERKGVHGNFCSLFSSNWTVSRASANTGVPTQLVLVCRSRLIKSIGETQTYVHCSSGKIVRDVIEQVFMNNHSKCSHSLYSV